MSGAAASVSQASARGGYAESLQDRLPTGTITSVSRIDAMGGYAEWLLFHVQ